MFFLHFLNFLDETIFTVTIILFLLILNIQIQTSWKLKIHLGYDFSISKCLEKARKLFGIKFIKPKKGQEKGDWGCEENKIKFKTINFIVNKMKFLKQITDIIIINTLIIKSTQSFKKNNICFV